jgi:hypothetical protein
MRRLTGGSLRILVISAGFPYHKDPHLYQWLWVYIMLPFLPEDSLNELVENYGDRLRKLYKIIANYPEAFERLVELIAHPLFFDELDEINHADDTTKSRRNPEIIIDDTQCEKFGSFIAFVKKLYDHCDDKYFMGHNIVLVLVSFGEFIFPLTIMLWEPKVEGKPHQSKNDLAKAYLERLKSESDQREIPLDFVDISFDSAYHVGKVVNAARDAGLRVTTKAKSHYTYQFEGESKSVKKIIETVKHRTWKSLPSGSDYQLYNVTHLRYGELVLVVRRRLKKHPKKGADPYRYDVLISTYLPYRAFQINNRYKKRWDIEMHFKYYKQYLSLGKTSYRRPGSVKSNVYTVAINGLLVALFRREYDGTISFRKAVKLIYHELNYA